MLLKILYMLCFFALSTSFCCFGYEYNDEFNVPPYAPPLNIAIDFSLCVTIYIAYGFLLLYKFRLFGIIGIIAALMIHFLFLHSKNRREHFINWCIPTYGGWALIYFASYLFMNKGK